MADLRPVKEAAGIMGLHEKTLRRNVKSGKCPGKIVGSRCFVDVAGFVPSTEPEPSDEVSKKEETVEVTNAKDATALANAEAEKLSAETAKIDAENKRDEAQGLRDKPDELKAREDALAVYEQQLNERATKIEGLESEISQRLETVRLVEIDTRDRAREVEEECEELRTETNNYVSEKEAELRGVEEELKQKRYTLALLEVKQEVELSAFTVKILEIRENLQLWLNYTLKHAGHYTKLGEKNGKQYDRYTSYGSALWDAYDILKDTMAWLDEMETNVDANLDDTQDEYEKRTNPTIARIKKVLLVAQSTTNGIVPSSKSKGLLRYLGK